MKKKRPHLHVRRHNRIQRASNTCICRLSIYSVQINLLECNSNVDGVPRSKSIHTFGLSSFHWNVKWAHWAPYLHVGADTQSTSVYKNTSHILTRYANGHHNGLCLFVFALCVVVCAGDMTQCCVCTFVVFIYLISYIKTTCGLHICSGVLRQCSRAASKLKVLDNQTLMRPIDLPQTKLIMRRN